jgi:PAS domain S-box-containing protein
LALLVILFLIKDISSTLTALTDNLAVLQKGEIPETNLFESANELGQMAGLTNALTKNLAELNRFAIDISKGDYSSEYQYSGVNDLLGKALVNLRNNLRISKEEDEKRKLEDERRNWTNKGHAIFGEILRQRSRELNKLTDDIIKNLVYYLKANQGGLFLINDSGDISKVELISAFAYDRKKFFERSINIGDGLIGTVALERNTVYLKEIPEDYIEIESGLGDAKPKCLLIVPLKFEEDILGIVEIASFTEFLDFEIKFVEEVAQSIASTLLTAKINARTQELLDESRKQSEILAAQEIEARQNMEEMRSTQELAQRREADLSGIISAVDNTLMKGEYEVDGTLISANNRHLQTMGYQLKEIKGKNIEMFIPKDELEHFRRVWANVVAGNSRQLEVRRRTKTGEDLWLINQYTPVTDISGRINKVLYFAHDITRYKNSEEELLQKATATKIENEELKNKISEFTDPNILSEPIDKDSNNVLNVVDSEFITFEITTDGKIVKANKRFEDLFKTTFKEIEGKLFSDFSTLKGSDNEYSEDIPKISTVKSNSAINNYTLKDGTSIWLHEFYTVVNDEETETVKIIVIAYDITALKYIEKQNEKLLIEANNISEDLIKKQAEMKKSIDELINEAKSSNLEENQKVIKVLNQSLARIDIDMNKNLIHINRAFSERFKFSERELLDKEINRLIDHESKAQFEIDLNLAFEEELTKIHTKLISKDKEIVDVDLNIIYLSAKGIESKKMILFIIENSKSEIIAGHSSELNEEIEKKNKELSELKLKMETLKKQVENNQVISPDANGNDSADLYDNWLNKIKKNLK